MRGTGPWRLASRLLRGVRGYRSWWIGMHPTPGGAGGFCALVRTWGTAPGPVTTACPHVRVIRVLEEVCFPENTGRLKVDLDSVGCFQGGPGNRCAVCSECIGIHPCFAYRPPSVWCTLPSESFLNCFVNKAATTAATAAFGLLPA